MTIQSLKTDVLIVGAGPAGLTAGLYIARAGKKALVSKAAGRPAWPSLMPSRTIRASPRSKAPISWPSSVSRRSPSGRDRVGGRRRFHARQRPQVRHDQEAVVEAGAVILATGKPVPKERMIPGEDRLIGQGVSYCATCDGPLFRGRRWPPSAIPTKPSRTSRPSGHGVPGRLGAGQVRRGGGRAKGAGPRGEGRRRQARAKIGEIRGEGRVTGVVVEAPSGSEVLPVSAVFIFREIRPAPSSRRPG